MDPGTLAKYMICSDCRGKVRAEGMFITCDKCKMAYPIIGGVPNMLSGDAWKLEKARKAKFTHKLSF